MPRELDPTWRDDELTFLLNPEALLFGNIVAQAACSADSLATLIGLPIDMLFWCAGSQGSMYPLNGIVQEHIGGVQASTLLTERMTYKMHREGLLWDSVGQNSPALCYQYPSPIIPKSRYRYQMVSGNQAGYYSGGSLYARNTVRNVQLVQVDLPNFRSGCGGIDAYLGGFSFINNDEIVTMMRNIMNNAKGYAFKLTLAEVTPLIKNVLGDLQTLANTANQMNVNSCETAEQLAGGIWPKTRANQQQVCQDIGSTTGIFKDWAEARQGCTSDDLNYNFDTTMQAGSKDAAYKNMILDNGNLVWKALQANNLVAGDEQLAELLMSLSGSIIIKKTGSGKTAKNHFEVLQSLATDHSLFKAILYGDTVKIYKCDETTQCLNPLNEKQSITISKAAAFVTRVAKLLSSIGQKSPMILRYS